MSEGHGASKKTGKQTAMTLFRLTRIYATFVLFLGVADLLAEEKCVWQQTDVFQDLDAFQAAAADSNFFYAINNATIAKIDRRTKKRVAVSNGEAKHLNSGFIAQGKMFCAHSNYPRSPESSQQSRHRRYRLLGNPSY